MSGGVRGTQKCIGKGGDFPEEDCWNAGLRGKLFQRAALKEVKQEGGVKRKGLPMKGTFL